jgi:hypothetical protein
MTAVIARASAHLAQIAPKLPTFTIHERDRQVFQIKALPIPHSPYRDYFRLVGQTNELFQSTMGGLSDHLRKMALQEGEPLLYIKNCPRNPFPGKTPEEDKHSPEKGNMEALFMLGVVGALRAKLFHDTFEKHGEPIAQVVSTKGKEGEQSSRGICDLPYHAEHVHLDWAIDYVLLSCIKGDEAAKTRIVAVDRCVEGLPHSTLQELQKPNFEMESGASFVGEGVWKGMKVKRIGPVLKPDRRGGFFIQYHGNLERMRGVTEEGRRALAHLTKQIEETPPYEVCLQNGDTLILDNSKTLHSRPAYTPTLPWEERRWLERGYAVRDYRALFEEILLRKISG